MNARPAVLALLLATLLALPSLAGPGPGGDENDTGTDDRRSGRSGGDEDDRVRSHGGRCTVTESRTREETTLDNGTRYRERTVVRARDCPGTADDRNETLTESEWDESPGPGPGARGRESVRIDRNHGLEVRIEHEDHGVNVTMRDNATRLELRDPRSDRLALEVAFLEVVEFEDANGDGAFDLDDRVLRTARVADLAADAAEADGVTTVTYGLTPGGTLAFRHRAESEREKFDVVFDGYAYETSTSLVALRAAFYGETASFRSDLRSPALVSSGAARAAYLDWVPTADADGVEKDVRSTVYVGGGAAAGTAQLYLTYPRGELVVHDPAVGFLDIQSIGPVVTALFDASAYVAAAGAAVAFLAAGFLARRRN